METTSIKITKTLSLTIGEASLRVVSNATSRPMPDWVKKPTPPDGYTYDQAAEMIDSFKAEIQSYEANASFTNTLRIVGIGRMVAVDAGLVTDQERSALKALCSRYGFIDPDKDTVDPDPGDIGGAIYELLRQFGEPSEIVETAIWIQGKAGYISQERVAEIIKSIRSARERNPDQGSGGADQSEAKVEGTSADNIVPAV